MLEMMAPPCRIGALAIAAGGRVSQYGLDATAYPPSGNRSGQPHRFKDLKDCADINVSERKSSHVWEDVIFEAQLPIAGVLRIAPGGLVGLEIKRRAVLKRY